MQAGLKVTHRTDVQRRHRRQYLFRGWDITRGPGNPFLLGPYSPCNTVLHEDSSGSHLDIDQCPMPTSPHNPKDGALLQTLPSKLKKSIPISIFVTNLVKSQSFAFHVFPCIDSHTSIFYQLGRSASGDVAALLSCTSVILACPGGVEEVK